MFINQELLIRIAEPDLLLVHPHAQRTGGKTFRNRFLARVIGSRSIYGRSFVPGAKSWRSLTDTDLQGYKACSDLFDFSDINVSRPYVGLAMMRDPVERAISLYGFARSKVTHSDHEAAMMMDIEDFYRRVAPRNAAYYINVQARRVCGYADCHLALEAIRTKFLGVGFTNEIDAFASALCDLFCWKKPVLDGNESNPRVDVTPRFRDFIRRQNAEDVALFEAIAGGPPYRISPRAFGFEARRMTSTAAHRMGKLARRWKTAFSRGN